MEIQLVVINWWLIALKPQIVSTRLKVCTCVPVYGLSSPMVVESLCCTWVSQALPMRDEHQWGAAGTCCAGLVGERETRALFAPQKPFLGRKVNPSRG